MPFDAVMVGSRVMVSKECATEDKIKDLIVGTRGVVDGIGRPLSLPPRIARSSTSVVSGTWEDSFEAEAGGVLTVLSELNEPIHNIANRATRFWREMDKRFFSLSKDQMLAALRIPANELFVINGLNKDFQKPFFPCKADGSLARSVMEMTYYGVAGRLLQLMHPHSPQCSEVRSSSADSEPSSRNVRCACTWIDHSYESKFRAWLLRIAERFWSSSPAQMQSQVVDVVRDRCTDPSRQSPSAKDLLHLIVQEFPQASSTNVCSEDELFFLQVCSKRGKPVNFVPTLDGELKTWMKKDSLWYSENLSSVPDHDPQRVVILHGPVAACYSLRANEPVAEILDGIHHGLLLEFQRRQLSGQTNVVEQQATAVSPDVTSPTILKPAALSVRLHCGEYLAAQQDSSPDTIFSLASQWWRKLATVQPSNCSISSFSWRAALLLSPIVIRNNLWVPNQLRELFVPRAQLSVEVSASAGEQDPVDRLRVFDSNGAQFGLDAITPVVEAHWDRVSERLTVILLHGHSCSPCSPSESVAKLCLRFRLSSVLQRNHETGELLRVLVEEAWEDRCRSIAQFYSHLWLRPAQAAMLELLATPSVQTALSVSHQSAPVQSHSFSSVQVLTLQTVTQFRAVIGDAYVPQVADIPSTGPACSMTGSIPAPMDYAIVLCWEPMIQALMEGACNPTYGFCDLLALVHLSNEFVRAPTPVVSLVSSAICEQDPIALTAALATATSRSFVGDRMLEEQLQLRSNDVVLVTCQLKGVWDEAEGRVITVEARIFKLLPISPNSAFRRLLHTIDVVSRFAIRKGFSQHEVEHNPESRRKPGIESRLFRQHKNSFHLKLHDQAEVAILLSKRWHRLRSNQVHVGDTLLLQIETLERPAVGPGLCRTENAPSRWYFHTRGTISVCECSHSRADLGVPFAEEEKHDEDSMRSTNETLIGLIEHVEEEAFQDPVLAYLLRRGQNLTLLGVGNALPPGEEAPVLCHPAVSLSAPSSNVPYAVASKDVNPIHTNPYAAVLAGLPGTIVHGMYSSAVGRRLLEQVTNGRVVRYRAAFTSVVHPAASLLSKITFRGLVFGNKVVSMEMIDSSSGLTVLRATAHVAQPPTAYLFTGQGSASVGVGMDLYDSCSEGAPARKVWDEADLFLTEKYGFSILEIVRLNPKRLRISFVGSKGSHLRHNWASLRVQNHDRTSPEDSEFKLLYPGASDPASDGIEFFSEDGLLFQTQFQQRKLVFSLLSVILLLSLVSVFGD